VGRPYMPGDVARIVDPVIMFEGGRLVTVLSFEVGGRVSVRCPWKDGPWRDTTYEARRLALVEEGTTAEELRARLVDQLEPFVGTEITLSSRNDVVCTVVRTLLGHDELPSPQNAVAEEDGPARNRAKRDEQELEQDHTPRDT